MDPYLGEIRMFAGTYAPQDWKFCDGSTLSISEYSALFALLGTVWGGDGVNTFAVPDLRGRVPVGQGQGAGLTLRVLGQYGGASGVQIQETHMPAHSHTLNVSTANGNTATVATGVGFATPAPVAGGTMVRYALASAVQSTNKQQLDGLVIANAVGGGASHSNLMPYLPVQYIISTLGMYPDRP